MTPWTGPGSSVQGDSPGKNTGVGCLALVQGICSTRGSSPHLSCLLHWQTGSLSLVPPGKCLPLHPGHVTRHSKKKKNWIKTMIPETLPLFTLSARVHRYSKTGKAMRCSYWKGADTITRWHNCLPKKLLKGTKKKLESY